MLDIIWCAVLYGASPNNYFYFIFFYLNHSKRKTYFTHRSSEKIIKKYNKNQYRHIYDNKILFAKKFKEFFGREWLDLKSTDYDTFEKFIEGKRRIIVKPADSAQGKGIKIINLNNNRNYQELYFELKRIYGSNGIVEDWIEQHEILSNIYPRAVNPVRIITIFDNGKCNFLVAGLTIGNGNEISNASWNDLVAPIDIKSGMIMLPAANFEKVYKFHPETGAKIQGIKVPFWDELLEMIDKTSKVVPEVGYVGWDIAITPNGPLIIEGNTSPGYKFYQIPIHNINDEGNLQIYKRFL